MKGRGKGPGALEEVGSEVSSSSGTPSSSCAFVFRLKQLLCYNAIVRPQYQCPGQEPTKEWGMKGTITAALQDLAVVQATCPLSSQGKTSRFV